MIVHEEVADFGQDSQCYFDCLPLCLGYILIDIYASTVSPPKHLKAPKFKWNCWNALKSRSKNFKVKTGTQKFSATFSKILYSSSDDYPVLRTYAWIRLSNQVSFRFTYGVSCSSQQFCEFTHLLISLLLFLPFATPYINSPCSSPRLIWYLQEAFEWKPFFFGPFFIPFPLFSSFFFTPLRKRGLSQPRLKVFLSGVVSTYGVDHHTSTTVEGGTRYHCCKVSS